MPDQDNNSTEQIRYPWREWSVAIVQSMSRFDEVCSKHDTRLDELDKQMESIKSELLTKARMAAILTGVITSVVSVGLTLLGLWLAYG